MISVVQNFICTIPERLKILEDNLPKVRDVWGDYQFFVNFNDTINLDEVYSLYQKYIPKLNFYNNLEKDHYQIHQLSHHLLMHEDLFF